MCGTSPIKRQRPHSRPMFMQIEYVGRRSMTTISGEANQLQPIEVEQKESLKLVKNTKGYNWEIKLLEINPDRLEEINNIMITKFNTEVK